MNIVKSWQRHLAALEATRFPMVIFCSFAVFLVPPVFETPVFASPPRLYVSDSGQFHYARYLEEQGDYIGAAREFGRLIEVFPGSGLVAISQFNMAMSLLSAHRYKEAIEGFGLFLSNFSEKEPGLKKEAGERLKEARLLARKNALPIVTLLPPKSAYPEGSHASASAMRGVQVMLFEGRTFGGIDAEMKRLKESGIDTVIFRVFHNKGDRYHRVAPSALPAGVYFKTSHAPVVADILPEIIRLAHKNGLKLFAWMTTRYADYGIEDKKDMLCKGYDLRSRTFYRCKGLDIFNGEALRRINAIYSDLADNDIDGVLFQDDLALKHNEGFGDYAINAFKRETGLVIDAKALYNGDGWQGGVAYTPLFWQWAAWKNRRLLDVAEGARISVRKKRPAAKFAINLMYESVTNPANSLAWLSQSLAKAVKAGFDYYSIMAYHKQMEDELQKDPETVRNLIDRIALDASKAVGSPEKVLIKFQTVDWKTGGELAVADVVRLIRNVKAAKNVSLAVVPYRKDFPFYELSAGLGKAGYAPNGAR